MFSRELLQSLVHCRYQTRVGDCPYTTGAEGVWSAWWRLLCTLRPITEATLSADGVYLPITWNAHIVWPEHPPPWTRWGRLRRLCQLFKPPPSCLCLSSQQTLSSLKSFLTGLNLEISAQPPGHPLRLLLTTRRLLKLMSETSLKAQRITHGTSLHCVSPLVCWFC